jgi:hypothetical protein
MLIHVNTFILGEVLSSGNRLFKLLLFCFCVSAICYYIKYLEQRSKYFSPFLPRAPMSVRERVDPQFVGVNF